MNKITVILNGYKRGHVLKQQYEAYEQQTIGKPNIMFWANLPNGNGLESFDRDSVNQATSAICNNNLGVWARFAFALNAKTPYVCVVDDDTIPGDRWLENCLDTLEELGHGAVLTTRGVRIKNGNYPQPDSYDCLGWSNPNENIEQVDFGGHCWFFPKRLLSAFWLESPDILPLNYGEDIHLSYSAWKVAGINTYVPRHIDPDFSGSIKEFGLDYGQDENATSRSYEASVGMNQYFAHIMNNGYVPVLQRNSNE